MKIAEIEIPDDKKAEDGEIVITKPEPIKYKFNVMEEEITQNTDITERIKTLEDACDWCRNNGCNQVVRELSRVGSLFTKERIDSPDLMAFLKLRVIVCALNEGWEPSKEDPGWMPRWLESKYCNLGVATCRDYLGNYAFKLGLKSIELALYAKEQFSDIYADFCGCKKGGEQ